MYLHPRELTHSSLLSSLSVGSSESSGDGSKKDNNLDMIMSHLILAVQISVRMMMIALVLRSCKDNWGLTPNMTMMMIVLALLP